MISLAAFAVWLTDIIYCHKYWEDIYTYFAHYTWIVMNISKAAKTKETY